MKAPVFSTDDELNALIERAFLLNDPQVPWAGMGAQERHGSRYELQLQLKSAAEKASSLEEIKGPATLHRFFFETAQKLSWNLNGHLGKATLVWSLNDLQLKGATEKISLRVRRNLLKDKKYVPLDRDVLLDRIDAKNVLGEEIFVESADEERVLVTRLGTVKDQSGFVVSHPWVCTEIVPYPKADREDFRQRYLHAVQQQEEAFLR